VTPHSRTGTARTATYPDASPRSPRRARRRPAVVRVPGLAGPAVLLAGLMALTGCSGPAPFVPDSPVVSNPTTERHLLVTSADTDEGRAVAEIYAGALNAAGIEATVTDATAEAGLADAVSAGFADVAPGRTGTLLLDLDAGSGATTADSVLEALREALPEHLAVLAPAAADSHSALVATAATAEQYDARNLSDLAPSCGKLTLGAPAGFRSSAQGLPGLEGGYDCVPGTFVALADDGGEAVQALISGSVDVVELPATQPAIVDHGLVVLEDPKTVFAAQQVVPVVTAKVVGQDAVEVLNRVSAELGSDDLTDLNRAVAGDARLTPAEAASDWLEVNGFTT